MDICAYKINSRDGGVVQVVESLPNKCEALSSNPSTTKTKQQKKLILIFWHPQHPEILRMFMVALTRRWSYR
jgi:hypothetical protein